MCAGICSFTYEDSDTPKQGITNLLLSSVTFPLSGGKKSFIYIYSLCKGCVSCAISPVLSGQEISQWYSQQRHHLKCDISAWPWLQTALLGIAAWSYLRLPLDFHQFSHLVCSCCINIINYSNYFVPLFHRDVTAPGWGESSRWTQHTTCPKPTRNGHT